MIRPKFHSVKLDERGRIEVAISVGTHLELKTLLKLIEEPAFYDCQSHSQVEQEMALRRRVFGIRHPHRIPLRRDEKRGWCPVGEPRLLKQLDGPNLLAVEILWTKTLAEVLRDTKLVPGAIYADGVQVGALTGPGNMMIADTGLELDDEPEVGDEDVYEWNEAWRFYQLREDRCKRVWHTPNYQISSWLDDLVCRNGHFTFPVVDFTEET